MTDNNMNTGAANPSSSADARAKAQGLAGEAKRAAQSAASSAADTARHQAEGAQNRAADEVSNFAGALRTAADEMRDGSAQERTFGQIAGYLADASDSIRDKDMGELVGDVTSFARRNPLIFLGGAAMLGFAASRFAKAGSRAQTGGPSSGGTSYDREAYDRTYAGTPAPVTNPVTPVASPAASPVMAGTPGTTTAGDL